MAIYALADLIPQVHPEAYVHPDAVVIGAVRVGAQASVWPAAVLRGDTGRIEIGARTSIQDGSVLHTTEEWPTVVGADCVVGHNAHLEGCTIGSGCLIGSGSIVLNRATLQAGSGVAAAGLVVEDAIVPTGHLAVGVPARYRLAPDLPEWVSYAVDVYVDLGRHYASALRRIA
jgi:carbonic anhydrase/acetyltransferase-like protein (isoleucine patch superfamily)